MSVTSPRTKRWTRVQYERAIDCGVFRPDERLELVDGRLVVREPQGAPHAAAVDRVVIALRAVFGEGWLVRAHAPLALGRRSRPEPDVSVVLGTPDDFDGAPPRHAALVVEVSQTSLRFDRRRKASVYARSGVAEYWIVNLLTEMLEVHRDPLAARSTPAGYRSIERLGRGATVSPLAAPTATIDVSSLFRRV